MLRVESGLDKFYVRFSGENFQEILDVCKSNGLKFNNDRDNPAHIGNKKQISRIILILEEIEFVTFFPSKEKVLDDLVIKLEVKEQKIRYNPRLLKAPPHPLARDIQIEGIRSLIKHNRHLLGDDTGLGKSFCSISALNHYKHHNLIDKIFIVTFRATLYNWKRELLKFSDNYKAHEIIILTKDERDFFIWSDINDYKVVITDYSTFKLISDYHYKLKYKAKTVKKYRKSCIPFDRWTTESNRCIILDECHKIKNHKSQTAKKIKMITQYFEYRYALSATPAPNMLNTDTLRGYKGKKAVYKQITNIFELWSIFEFLDPNIICETYESLASNYANIGNRFSMYAINYVYGNKVQELLNYLNKFITRRFKKDIPNFPKQILKPVYVKMNKKHFRLYQEICQGYILKMYEEEGEITHKQLQSRFLDKNLVCSEPSIVNLDIKYAPNLEKLLSQWKFTDNSKVSICDSIVEDIIDEKNEKLIIWSYHPKTIDLLEEHYKKYNPIKVHGQIKVPGKITKDKYIDDLLYKFETDKDIKLAFLSPLCLSAGVNLQFCKYAIYFDRNYDAETYLQSLGRIHRLTSISETYIYLLLLLDSVEINLHEALEDKEDLNYKLGKDQYLSKSQIKQFFLGKEITL
jgi:SNF2 family DNA or RNA helicase